MTLVNVFCNNLKDVSRIINTFLVTALGGGQRWSPDGRWPNDYADDYTAHYGIITVAVNYIGG